MTDPLKRLAGIELLRYSEADAVPYKRDNNSPSFAGSYGTVSKFHNNGNEFAIKELQLSISRNRKDRQSFLLAIESEIRLLRQCEHPNLLKFVEAYIIDTISTSIFLVTQPWAPLDLGRFLELVCAEELPEYSWWSNSTLFDKCCPLFQGLLNGLKYLHEHLIMHKDLKPENILIDGMTPIIADFGISKVYRPGATTAFTKSTVQYLAPEQIAHIESGLQADIFALGCCFLLIFAAACSGINGINRILDTVLELPGSCQYARELHRLQPILMSMIEWNISEHFWLGFMVRDMLLKDPRIRPNCKELARFFDLVTTHEALHLRSDGSEPFSNSTCSLLKMTSGDSFEWIDRVEMQPSFVRHSLELHGQETKALDCTSPTLKDSQNPDGPQSQSHDPASLPAIVVSPDGISERMRLSIDTGSEVSLISLNAIEKLVNANITFERHQFDQREKFYSLGGSLIHITESVTLRLRVYHSGQWRRIKQEFFGLPFTSTFELLVGYKAASRMGLLKAVDGTLQGGFRDIYNSIVNELGSGDELP